MSSLQVAREQALKSGIELDGYHISRVLGVGGFGVTY